MNNSNLDQDDIIFCQRCGQEMKKSQRCCMKCGALNYDHPDNASMRRYIKNETLTVNKKKIVESGTREKKPQSKYVCLTVNIVIHLLLIVLSVFLMKDVFGMFNTIFLSILLYGVLFLYNYSMQVIYIKADKKWWSYFIPIYNFYIYYEITMKHGWFFLLMFVPVVGVVVSIISSYKLGVRFGKSGWFTLFLPFIAIPVIAFSKNAHGFSARNSFDEGKENSEINKEIN